MIETTIKSIEMTNNPIPDQLRSEHLLLLVGTNPLPDWVAAKLLLRDGGQLWLVHSGTTGKVAERVARYVYDEKNNEENKIRRPQYIPVTNPYDSESVKTAIESALKNVRSDSIGLNYTGGTKVMAVHTHRAVTQAFPGKAILSYLEAARCMMHFEPVEPHYPRGWEILVGMAEWVKLSLKELFVLHEEFRLANPENVVKAEPVAEMLLDVYQTYDGQSAWRKDCNTFLKRKDNPQKFKSATELKTQPISCARLYPHISEALIPGGSTGTKNLGAVVSQPDRSFTDVEELAEWLDGKWLEHIVLDHLKMRQADYQIHSFGRNINPFLGRIDFEIDVAAMRGYQLHAISCYTGSVKATCKQKLFEVFTRARQLGGDEARAALVCCFDDPRKIEEEAGEVWDVVGRVKVFGRADLQKLGEQLKKWFDTGAQ